MADSRSSLALLNWCAVVAEAALDFSADVASITAAAVVSEATVASITANTVMAYSYIDSDLNILVKAVISEAAAITVTT